ncbi:uncharacterized protein [Cherax quadricarinatus]|uniref:uncharacterized protein n=1 Tax=Cherax quadricarinatus TaxID=27406 RepID=UPI002379FBB2|nr:uncharacterized protein LOC128684488 [Cherax quadricarinatus]
MALQALFCAFLCSCAVRAVPQTYGILEVVEPQPSTEQLGPFQNIVSSAIDFLPDITNIFQMITRVRDPSSKPADLKAVEEIILSFLPITEKMMTAAAKAEGREVKPEDLERLARVSKILPSYFQLIEDITKRDFSGIPDHAGSGSGSSADAVRAAAGDAGAATAGAATASDSVSALLPEEQSPVAITGT